MFRVSALLAVLSHIIGIHLTSLGYAEDKAAAREDYCAARETLAEQQVCLNKDLTRQDALLWDLYQELHGKLSPSDAKGLSEDQRTWQRERDLCGAKTDCLTDKYTDRIADLEQMLENLAFPNKSHVEIGCGPGHVFVDGECLIEPQMSAPELPQPETSEPWGSASKTQGYSPSAPASLSCDRFGKLKSLVSETSVTVEFVNNSDGYRSLVWINFKGMPVQYAGLERGESIQQQTYLTHPWMFTDGPGNCIEMFMPQEGVSRFEITVPSPVFGPEND